MPKAKLHNLNITHKKIRLFFWILSILIGLINIWSYKYILNPNGMHYVEMAEKFINKDWYLFINGFFSPLYPIFLSIFLKAFQPNPYHEVLVVQIANFFMLLLTFAAYEYFIKQYLLYYKNISPDNTKTYLQPSSKAIRVLAYVFFMWTGIIFIQSWSSNPDMFVAAFLYLAWAILFKIKNGSSTFSSFGLLGLVLGLSYLTKAVMFIMSFVFIACSIFLAKNIAKNIPKVIFTFFIFLLVASSYIVPLSFKKDI